MAEELEKEELEKEELEKAELEKALLRQVKERLKARIDEDAYNVELCDDNTVKVKHQGGKEYNVDHCDEITLLKMGNPEEFYDARYETIIELIRKIRKLDGIKDNVAHPLIDEIIKTDDYSYSLETHVTRLTKLLEETSVRHCEGLPPPFKKPNMFAFKFQDRKGRIHLFNCDIDAPQSLMQVTSAIKLRVGDEFDGNNPPELLCKDGNDEKIVIASDSDLTDAVNYARSAGRKVLKLYLDYSACTEHVQPVETNIVESTHHIDPVRTENVHTVQTNVVESTENVKLVETNVVESRDNVQPAKTNKVENTCHVKAVSVVGLGVVLLAFLCKIRSTKI